MSLVNRAIIRQLFVFVLFLVVASSLWLLKALNEEYETYITVDVTVTDIPEGVELDADEELEMQVRVLDRGTSLVSYFFGGAPKIKVDYSEMIDDNGCYTIPVSQLKNRVASKLHSTTELLHFKDENFSVNIKRRYGKLPVNAVREMSSAPHFEVKSVRIMPEEVKVSAPHSVFGWLHEVEAESVRINELDKDTVIELRVLTDEKYVNIEPLSVKLSVDVEPLEKVRLDVPLVLVNLPKDATKVRNFKYVYNVPDSVSVDFEVSKDDLRRVSPSDFKVELDFDEVKTNRAKTLTVNLSSIPEYVIDGNATVVFSDVEIEPSRVGDVFKYALGPSK